MAPVGTEIRVRFFALDYTLPSDMELSSEVFRTITIVEPCKDGQFFCEDDRTCSDIACDRREEFLGTGDEDRPPVVRLVVSAVTPHLAGAHGASWAQRLPTLRPPPLAGVQDQSPLRKITKNI